MKKSSKETDKLKWETDGVFTRISGVNSTNKIENLTHVKSKVPKSHFNRRVMAHKEKNEIYFQMFTTPKELPILTQKMECVLAEIASKKLGWCSIGW